jgi:imidazolonepropionase-like amidohydrolase
MRRTILIGLMVTTLSSTAASATPQIALKTRAVIDVRRGVSVPGAVILIENGHISAVGTNVTVPTGVKIIDLSRLTLIPGLIDTHTHLLSDYQFSGGGFRENMTRTILLGIAARVLLGAKNAREMLEGGFTAVRDVGNSGLNGDVELRRAIDKGWITGPTMAVSTRIISPVGGQAIAFSHDFQRLMEQEYVQISGVEEARRAVAQAVYDGADLIKVVVENEVRQLTPDEMKVIVEEAHRSRRKVAVHVEGDASAQIAVDAAADSIEHGYRLSDETITRMAKQGTFLVPTDWTIDYLEQTFKQSYGEDARRLAGQVSEGHSARLQRAMRAGVKIAFGSDAMFNLDGLTRGQTAKLTFRAYAEGGMSSLEILRSATLRAAELLGWEQYVGCIEPGMFATLVAVDGDPLTDYSSLERVRFVMKGGAVVLNLEDTNAKP